MIIGPVIIASFVYGLFELIPLLVRQRKMSQDGLWRLWLFSANIPLVAAYLTGNDMPKDQSLPLFLTLNLPTVLFGLIIWVFVAHFGLCNQDVQRIIFKSSPARVLKRVGGGIVYFAAIASVYWLALFLITDPKECTRVNCHVFVLLIGSKNWAYSSLWTFSIFSSLSILIVTMSLVAFLAPRLWPGSSEA